MDSLENGRVFQKLWVCQRKRPRRGHHSGTRSREFGFREQVLVSEHFHEEVTNAGVRIRTKTAS